MYSVYVRELALGYAPGFAPVGASGLEKGDGRSCASNLDWMRWKRALRVSVVRSLKFMRMTVYRVVEMLKGYIVRTVATKLLGISGLAKVVLLMMTMCVTN